MLSHSQQGEAEWNFIFVGFFLELANNMNVVSGGESWPEASLFLRLMLF